MTPYEARHQRMIQRLRDVAGRYRELVMAGDRSPAKTIAAEHGVTESAARSWVHRARSAGFLPSANGPRPFADPHQPRKVDWGRDSWIACERCKQPWPCFFHMQVSTATDAIANWAPVNRFGGWS